MSPYLRWILYFPFVQLISIFCKLTAPLVCIFYRKEYRLDRVKVFDNEVVGFDREYLILSWWGSHDNAHDEYFWGGFSKYSVFPFIVNCTVNAYKSNSFIRYLYRLLWIYRNTAYGFSYYLFGRNKDQSHFQIKKDIPIGFGYYNSINIGWKEHRSAPNPNRLMYAGRIIGIRKKK